MDSQDKYCHKAMDDARDYVDTRFKAIDDAVKAAYTAIDEATKAAYGAMDKRLESMNEFRAQLNDQTANFVVKAEFETVTKDIDGIKQFRTQFLTRAEHDVLIKEVQGVKDQLPNFVTHAEHLTAQSDIRELRESRATLAGKASQNSVTVAYLISVVGLIIGAVGIVLHFVH